MTTDKYNIQLRAKDPFEKLLIPMVQTNRIKRADYASDDNIYLNFDRVASSLEITPAEVIEVMIGVKQARLINLKGRDPVNEAILDSYLDRAVYSILAYGNAQRPTWTGMQPSGGPI